MAVNAPDLLRYKHYSIDRNNKLGGGTFGIVYMAKNTLTRKPVCAKHVFNSAIEFSQIGIDNMKRASKHPNIVKFYDSFIHGGASWIVMEYCPGTTLDEHMRTNPDYPERVGIVYQTTQAVNHLHTLDPPMAHRDVKAPNIMISPGPLVKVCDFDLAKSLVISGSVNATTFAGTPNYLPPELYLSTVRYDALKSDIFSLGLVFLGTMTCGENENMDAFFTPVTEEVLSRKTEVTKAEEGAPVPSRAPARTPTRAPTGAPAQTSKRAPTRVTTRVVARAKAPTSTRTPTLGVPPAPSIPPSREMNWKTATVTAAGETQMPDGISWYVAFDQHGAAILTDKSHILLYHHNPASSTSSPSHRRKGKIPLPCGFESHYYKAITDTKIAVQIGNDDAPTVLFRRSLLPLSYASQLNTLHHSGKILGALGDHLVYATMRSTNDYIISVHRAGDEMILEPTAGRTWSDALSVCKTSRFITVVESYTKSLTVFSVTGEHISYRRLEYWPRSYSGISPCGDSHVVVVQTYPPAVQIHQLPGGEKVRNISGAELGLVGNDWIWAVQYSEQGILHLATGPCGIFGFTRSLRTYKVTE